MSEYLSKRVKKKYGTGISTTRWDYLSLDEAEPDLGNPLTGPSSIGARPYPSGGAYILASFAQTDKQDRYWVPPSALSGLGLGVIPGAFTIQDEGVLVGAASSFTTVNFVGPGVTVDSVGPNPEDQTGIATVRIVSFAGGVENNFQYHGPNGALAGAPNFIYDSSNLYIGIGETQPDCELDIDGRLKVSGVSTITSLFSDALTSDTILIEQTAQLKQVSIGTTEVISEGRELKNIVGLDSTTTTTIEQAIQNAPNDFTSLNVIGVSTFQDTIFAQGGLQIGGGSELAALNVTGVSTFGYIVAAGATITGVTTAPRLNAGDIEVSGIATIGLIDGNAATFTGEVDVVSLQADDVVVSGITTVNWLKAKYANVSTALTALALTVQTGATVSGLTSTGSVYTNTIETTSNVDVGGDLTVDTDTLVVDASTDRVGINSAPLHSLHVEGDMRVSDKIYVSNGEGISGQVLLSQGASAPPVWGAPANVTVGAAQSVYLTNTSTNTSHFLTLATEDNDVGSLTVDSSALVFNPSTNRLGIATDTPGYNLEVIGDINFTGTLFQNDDVAVFSRWDIDNITSDIYRFTGNIGIGTSVLTEKFTVSGTSLFQGYTNITEGQLSVGVATITNFDVGAGGTTFSADNDLGKVGIQTTVPRAELEVKGTTISDGTFHFEGTITEEVQSTFGTDIPSTAGEMTLDVGASTVIVGVLTETVSKWKFTNVPTENGKATTVTLIVDSNSLLGYGESCSVNNVDVSGGVRWGGGIAPLPTNNEDILSFTIAKDSTGSIRVYGSSSLNFS